jgi:hypothetical protein
LNSERQMLNNKQKIEQMKKLQTTLASLAGLVDTSGCSKISTNWKRGRRDNTSDSHESPRSWVTVPTPCNWQTRVIFCVAWPTFYNILAQNWKQQSESPKASAQELHDVRAGQTHLPIIVGHTGPKPNETKPSGWLDPRWIENDQTWHKWVHMWMVFGSIIVGLVHAVRWIWSIVCDFNGWIRKWRAMLRCWVMWLTMRFCVIHRLIVIHDFWIEITIRINCWIISWKWLSLDWNGSSFRSFLMILMFWEHNDSVSDDWTSGNWSRAKMNGPAARQLKMERIHSGKPWHSSKWKVKSEIRNGTNIS